MKTPAGELAASARIPIRSSYLQNSFGKANSAVTVTITGSAPATATHAVIVLGLWIVGIAIVQQVL